MTTTDGSLHPWSDVAELHAWKALLVGNGLSIDISRDFAYSSLYERAMTMAGEFAFTQADIDVFEAHSTENFEVVLQALSTTATTVEALGEDGTLYQDAYDHVQATLAAAVRSVHLPLIETPSNALATIKDVLLKQRQVFTTNYDMLLYWAMGHGDDYGPLVDCLWHNRFDPKNIALGVGKIPVYLLHGAMHLVSMSDGTTCKVTRGKETVLEQFGKPYDGDSHARPLLITEGSWHDKLQAIEDNDYLSHALGQFRRCALPLVIFGSSLGDQDQHLADAINLHPERPVAI
jgi:hypothetical protein